MNEGKRLRDEYEADLRWCRRMQWVGATLGTLAFLCLCMGVYVVGAGVTR